VRGQPEQNRTESAERTEDCGCLTGPERIGKHTNGYLHERVRIEIARRKKAKRCAGYVEGRNQLWRKHGRADTMEEEQQILKGEYPEYVPAVSEGVRQGGLDSLGWLVCLVIGG